MLLFERYALPHIKPTDSVLELGPDGFPSSYRSSTPFETACWHTLDFPGDPRLTHTLDDPYRFPVESETYDVVISGQVAEHVPKLWRWMPEVARVCKPNGIVVTVAPVSWPYHEAPQDCWRIYPDGLRALYEDAGLEVLVSEWESLELDRLRRRLPRIARGRRGWSQLSGLLLLLHDKAHSPVEGAFDSIAVGRRLRSPLDEPQIG